MFLKGKQKLLTVDQNCVAVKMTGCKITAGEVAATKCSELHPDSLKCCKSLANPRNSWGEEGSFCRAKTDHPKRATSFFDFITKFVQ